MDAVVPLMKVPLMKVPLMEVPLMKVLLVIVLLVKVPSVKVPLVKCKCQSAVRVCRCGVLEIAVPSYQSALRPGAVVQSAIDQSGVV